MELKRKAINYIKAWCNSKKGFDYPAMLERLNSFASEPYVFISKELDSPQDILPLIKGPYSSILTLFLFSKISSIFIECYLAYLKNNTLPGGFNAHLFISSDSPLYSIRAYDPGLIASFYREWQEIENLRKNIMLSINGIRKPTELCLLAFKKPSQ